MDTEMTEIRYRAFISYCRKDQRWAHWLHRRLETYKFPCSIPGLSEGTSGRYLGPCFIDREELSASPDLSESLRVHLNYSAALLVVCSPNAVRSEFVGEEIQWFRTNFPDRPVLALIVEGEPNASATAGDNGLECFPLALRSSMDKSSPQSLPPPLAADVRPWADGKRAAFLKVAAGLAGLPYSDLSRRDLARKRRQTTILAGSIFLATIGLGFILKTWRKAEQQAHQIRVRRELQTYIGATPLDILEFQTRDNGCSILLRSSGVEILEPGTGGLRYILPLSRPRLLSWPDKPNQGFYVEYENRVRGAFGLQETGTARTVVRVDPVRGEVTPVSAAGFHADSHYRVLDEKAIAVVEPKEFISGRTRLSIISTTGQILRTAFVPDQATELAYDPGIPAQNMLIAGQKGIWVSGDPGSPSRLEFPTPNGADNQWISLHSWGGLITISQDFMQLVRRNGGQWQRTQARPLGDASAFTHSLRNDRYWCLLDDQQALLCLNRLSGEVEFGPSLIELKKLDPRLVRALLEPDTVKRMDPDGHSLRVLAIAGDEGWFWTVPIRTSAISSCQNLPTSIIKELKKASLVEPSTRRSRLLGVGEYGALRAIDATPYSDLTLAVVENGHAAWIGTRDRMVKMLISRHP